MSSNRICVRSEGFKTNSWADFLTYTRMAGCPIFEQQLVWQDCRPFNFVKFETAEDRDKAIAAINSGLFRGYHIKASRH